MNEIEKLYENAEVDKMCDTFANWMQCDWKTRQCEDCEHFVYPPFTVEKQLELIKWLIIEGYIEDMLTVQISEENFEACLADTFNELWQDLTEEERTQIKEILE